MAQRELDGDELCDEKFEYRTTGPCAAVPRIKLLLLLPVECLNIVGGEGGVLVTEFIRIGDELVEQEDRLLEGGNCSKEVLNGGSNVGTGLNVKGLDDICGVVNVGDTEERVLRIELVRLGFASHIAMSVDIPLNGIILLCGTFVGIEDRASIGGLS